MITTQHIPFWLIVFLLMAAGGIWLTFWLIRSFFLPLLKGKQKKRRWSKNAFRAELLLWTLFFSTSLYFLLQRAPVITLVFVGLLLLLGRLWWRDFFPGMLFRLQDDAEAGDFLIYENQRYTIEAIRARHLKIRSNKGTFLILPYRLMGKVHLAKAAQKTALVPFSFELVTTASASRIEEVLAESPWSAPAQLPEVQSLDEETYQVITYAPSEEIKEKQERYLRERLGGV